MITPGRALSDIRSLAVQHGRVEAIRAEVAARYGVPPADLHKPRAGKHETRQIKKARFEAMALARERLGWSYPRIGKAFGGYHHTTVMHGIAEWRGGERA